MRKSTQSIIENILIILLFIGGANLFVLIKTSGIDASTISFSTSRDVTVLSAHLRVIEAGFLVGVLVLLYESYVHPFLTKNRTFLWKRIIWQIDVAVLIILPNFLIYAITEYIESEISIENAFEIAFEFIMSGLFLSFFIYYYILSILISFLRRMHQTFGQHIFYNYLMGKYSRPKEEDRVFMFIDLNDSTKLAEELGHIKYSRLLNRCFDDIIESIKDIDYEIYQFVGDEIVLTWLSDKDTSGKALLISKAFNKKFKENYDTFKTKFGVFPKFKSAVSRGKVSATLVGDNSKSIAYHGDVLNTTARILGLCKKYNQEILISEFYVNNISTLASPVKMVDRMQLKGKEMKVGIFAVA